MNKQYLFDEIVALTKSHSWMSEEEIKNRVVELGTELWRITKFKPEPTKVKPYKGPCVKITYQDGREPIFESAVIASEEARVARKTIQKFLDYGECDKYGRSYDSCSEEDFNGKDYDC
ncbi:hypothetical protein IGI37_000071 [Enterococcus sp. AZ194]|uniref:hypothetical protein n=1 Tax=Enterococcus sp. AZ194 TaxID=2774629 RepID=UPI003F1F5C12